MFHALSAGAKAAGLSKIKCAASLRIECMTSILKLHLEDSEILSELYQRSKRTEVTLAEYLESQLRSGVWGSHLDMAFISIVYGIRIKSLQWFGLPSVMCEVDSFQE